MESRRFLFLFFGSTGGLVSGWLFCTIMLPVLPCSLATLTSRLGWNRWRPPAGGHPLDGQVTNYRFRKSMGWEIKPSLLYQAYVKHSDWKIEIWGFPSRLRDITTPRRFPAEIPTVTRDIIYGWARGLVGPLLLECFSPTTFVHKAANTTGKKSGTGWESSIFFELK